MQGARDGSQFSAWETILGTGGLYYRWRQIRTHPWTAGLQHIQAVWVCVGLCGVATSQRALGATRFVAWWARQGLVCNLLVRVIINEAITPPPPPPNLKQNTSRQTDGVQCKSYPTLPCVAWVNSSQLEVEK